jgi:hypothetical protein
MACAPAAAACRLLTAVLWSCWWCRASLHGMCALHAGMASCSCWHPDAGRCMQVKMHPLVLAARLRACRVCVRGTALRVCWHLAAVQRSLGLTCSGLGDLHKLQHQWPAGADLRAAWQEVASDLQQRSMRQRVLSIVKAWAGVLARGSDGASTERAEAVREQVGDRSGRDTWSINSAPAPPALVAVQHGV